MRDFTSQQTVWMKMLIATVLLVASASASATVPPLVYEEENLGAPFPKPAMPPAGQLPVIRELPDPLLGVNDFRDWERKRNEISAQIQHYGIGEKPSMRNQSGGRVEQEGAIDISNVMLLHNGKTTRVGFKTDGDKKVRVAKKTGDVIG